MTEVHDLALAVLREVVSQPTAPYHEQRVAARVAAYLQAWGIPFSTDEDGNIFARYQHGPACRPLMLMAHMDHPGFTLTASESADGTAWTATLEGGVPAAYFRQPVAVRVYPRVPGAPEEGLRGLVSLPAGEVPGRLAVRLEAPAGLARAGDFGMWDMPAYELRGSLIHARALDDLAGCCLMLMALRQAAAAGLETDLYAVFTRAEEVGLVGAEAVLRGGRLPRHGYLVSLEASAVLPGVEQGGGPVIRVGDRVTTFSQEAELVLKAAAHRLGATIWQPERGRPSGPARVSVQRHLMSGGTCEATAAILHGYQATGLSLPLGNYHNMGPDAVLAPETIHLDDYLTGVALVAEAARLMPEMDAVRAAHAASFAPAPALLARLRLR
jgi:putative aminopeptidase FrvX